MENNNYTFCNNFFFVRNICLDAYCSVRLNGFFKYVLSRPIKFGCQCHFKIWLDCHKFKKFPCLIMPMSTKCQKNENKMTINVIQHDDRL
jgi:hypothetical protein